MEKFWSKVRKGRDDECWPWTAGRWGGKKAEYGGFWFEGRKRYAHRISHLLSEGLGAGSVGPEVVMHTCDNPLCCNPSHLLAGTQKENIRDSVRKGRWNRSGARNGRAKLDWGQVREIRRLRGLGFGYARIASLFGTGVSTVGMICTNRTWSPEGGNGDQKGQGQSAGTI